MKSSLKESSRIFSSFVQFRMGIYRKLSIQWQRLFDDYISTFHDYSQRFNCKFSDNMGCITYWGWIWIWINVFLLTVVASFSHLSCVHFSNGYFFVLSACNQYSIIHPLNISPALSSVFYVECDVTIREAERMSVNEKWENWNWI